MLYDILIHNGIVTCRLCYGPGGHSHWKGVWGCAAVMTPFFQASRRSLAHQFTLNAPLLCLLFSSFRKFLHFQPCFGQNSSSLNPHFFRKIRSLDPTFWNRRGTHTPNKSWVPPPPWYGLCASVDGGGGGGGERQKYKNFPRQGGAAPWTSVVRSIIWTPGPFQQLDPHLAGC